MRLVHVITDLGFGGAQGVLAQLLSQTRARFEHHVLSLRSMRAGAERFLACAASVDALDLRPALAPLAAPRRLASSFRRLRPDLVVTWLYHADLLGGLVARRMGLPVCWNVRHGPIDRRRTSWATQGVVRACGALSRSIPQAVVFNSERSSAAHAAWGYRPRRIEVIANGVDLERFGPDPSARDALRRELGLPHDAPLVGIAGRYCPDKDFETFFAAAARIADRRSEVRFVGCGPGVEPSNAALRRSIERRDLAASTRLLGVRHDMPRVLAALDVLVCSSRTEGFPNVVAEALACGVPVASTDVGDVGSLVGDAGRIVAVGDAAALAAACHDLLENRQSVAALARPRAARHGSLARMTAEFTRVWESVARPTPPRRLSREIGAEETAHSLTYVSRNLAKR